MSTSNIENIFVPDDLGSELEASSELFFFEHLN
jgi:hypothetical protein